MDNRYDEFPNGNGLKARTSLTQKAIWPELFRKGADGIGYLRVGSPALEALMAQLILASGGELPSSPVASANLNIGVSSITTLEQGYKKAFITVEGSFRFWVTGDDPTTDSGHLCKDDAVIRLDNAEEVNKFKAIAIDAVAKISITYYA